MNKLKNKTNKDYKTEQECFWAGDFGNKYISRNRDKFFHASNLSLFSTIMKCTAGVQSIIELGANIGLNMMALRSLLPKASCAGVEINAKAVAVLRRIKGVEAIHDSLFDFKAKECDFSFTKGVMIHLNPDLLPRAYDQLAKCGRKYVAIIEYYNPSPVEVAYRGHSGRLFKRDFAGEFLSRHSEYKLINYGFVYHRDPIYPQDDLTWFLMENRAEA